MKRLNKRVKRGMRVRKKLIGSAQRPRLSVFKSLKYIGAQLIDDEQGVSLGGFSTLSKEGKGLGKSREGASLVGKRIAAIAKEKGVESVIFDRGIYKYHGLVQVVAESARELGLRF